MREELRPESSCEQGKAPELVDVRDLTPVGIAFAILSASIVILGAIALYVLRPFERVGLHIHGTGPALFLGIPIVVVAIAFFRVSRFLSGLVGIPFYYVHPLDQHIAETQVPDHAAPSDYPCAAEVFQLRVRRFNKTLKLARVSLCWGMVVGFACCLGYDHVVGVGGGVVATVSYLAVSGLISLGPFAYLSYHTYPSEPLSRFQLVCPTCAKELIGDTALEVSKTHCCPGCGDLLVDQ